MDSKTILNSRRFRYLKRIVFSTQTHCWRCGKYVDQYKYNDKESAHYDPQHRLARSCDHVNPLDRGGAPYDLSNLRLAHKGCNSKAGRALQENIKQSRNW